MSASAPSDIERMSPQERLQATEMFWDPLAQSGGRGIRSPAWHTTVLEAGRDFYDASEPGAGTCLVASLLTDIESLARLHGIHPIHAGLHRMLARRFCFGIYYYEDLPTKRISSPF